MSDLYSLIQQLCNSHNISLAFLERECSLGNGTIKKWGTAIPSADRLKRVADYFNVSMEYLLVNKHSPSIRQGRQQLPFARNLKRIRERKGLSFEQLSEMISFTPQELQGFESGLLIPDEEAVAELASALKVSEDLLEDNDFVAKNLKEVELSEWIKKRNEQKAVFDDMKFWYSFTDRFDESMPEEQLLEYGERLDKMKLELLRLKEELTEALKLMPLMKVMDVYEYYLEQKILDLTNEMHAKELV